MKISKKKVLLSLFVVVCLLMIPLSVIAEEYVIKYAGTARATVEDAEYQAMLKFKEVVEEKSNGKIKIEVYPSNQLGATKEFTEGVSLGTIEMAVVGYSIIGQFDPIANVLELPYMYRDLNHFMAVSTGPIGDEINQRLIKTTGMRVLAILPRGARQVMNGERPIREPEDLKGLKIRSPECDLDFVTIREMGGIPVPITWGEVYTALSQGVVSGVENTIEELYNAKLYEVQKYLSLTKHIYLGIPIIINEKFYSGLPENYRKIILEAARESQRYRTDLLKTSEDKALAKMKEAGIEVIADPDIEAFAARAEKMWEHFVDGKNITWDMIKRIIEYNE